MRSPSAVTAFTVIGYDGTNAVLAPSLSQSSPPAVPVNFAVVDPTPVLANASATLGLAAVNPLQFPITFDTLVNKLGATWFKATGAQQEFKITTNSNHTTFGTVYLNGVAQADNTTFTFHASLTDTLTWTPPVIGGPPSAIPVLFNGAFTVHAYDTYNVANFGAFPAFATSTGFSSPSKNS